MQSKAKNIDDYLKELPEDRKIAISKLREVINKNIPEGFQECMNYGMIGYVIPHSIYPAGYHCTPELPLPFANIASQKNFIAFYHMGLYGNPELFEWFKTEYEKQFSKKLDAGKSCSRFKKVEHIPYELIGELMQKISVEDYIKFYELTYKNNTKTK
ncbi:MAG: DUF1801 domain-containing protein [Limnohabitans sp.]|nr:DUF1801 domain-containing protein [Limnohabitans sp.]